MVLQNSPNSHNAFVQFVSASLTTLQSVTTLMPADDTIPQNTEGDEVLTVTITPKFSTSNLMIKFSGMLVKNTSGSVQVALFQDTTADALSAKSFLQSDNQNCYGDFQHIMTSGTTSSTTFKIRVGPAANTIAINGQGVSQLLGGVANTILTVMEYL